MTIHVYHAQYRENFSPEELEIFRDIIMFPKEDAIKAALAIGMYKKAAVVQSDDLEYAFEKTNSIDRYWGENPEVKEVGDKNKSTSVGDLMIKDDKLYMVASFGFDELDSALISQLPSEPKKPKIF